MKTSVTKHLSKVLAGAMLVAIPVFASCDKDNSESSNSTPSQQRTEEFIYDTGLKFYRPGGSEKIPHAAFSDTVAKYAIDGTVKQIHIKPETPKMLENSPEYGMVSRANVLDEMYNKSNNKLSGENTTLFLDSAALCNQTVQQVLHGKLKIELVQKR